MSSTTGFRARFDCLWCGTDWQTRGPDGLEGWAKLCPACLGKAGTNPFLRGRLRDALAARSAATRAPATAPPAVATETAAATESVSPGVQATRPASASLRLVRDPAFPDAWFLRRDSFEHGAVHDAAWQAELDMVTRWLDGLPFGGRIDEPAAGVGFFSPLLAERGELHASDVDGEALDRARDRLLAHRLRAHLHVRDPWAGDPSDGAAGGVADAVVAAFLVGRVRGAGLDGAATSLHARLRSGGLLAMVDLRPDQAGGPPPGTTWTYHAAEVLEAALVRAGFEALEIRETGRFFLTLRAVAR